MRFLTLHHQLLRTRLLFCHQIVKQMELLRKYTNEMCLMMPLIAPQNYQLSLIWLTHNFKLLAADWQPCPVKVWFHFYVDKCDILYQLMCGGKISLWNEPARWPCDNFQQMSDFDSCQLNLIRMAYTTDRLVSIFVQDVMWHLTSPYM